MLYTQKNVNSSYLYDEIYILKIWTNFVERALKCKYYCGNANGADLNGFVTNLFTAANSLSLPQARQSGIICNPNNTLYLIPGINRSVSICGKVNFETHHSAGINEITDNLKLACNQIKSWNSTAGLEKITAHEIIFCYRPSNNHWALGQLSLSFSDVDISTTIKIIDPLGQGQLLPAIAEDIKTLVSTIFAKPIIQILPPNNTHIKQQHDGTSCGAITAENGKFILLGISEKLNTIYPQDALALRLAHLNDVQDENFSKKQWQRQFDDHEITGGKLANADLVKTALSKHIEKLSPEDKKIAKSLFNTLYHVNEACKNYGDFIEKLQKLLKKQRTQAGLAQNDITDLSRYLPNQTYLPNHLEQLISDPYGPIKIAIKEWLRKQKGRCKIGDKDIYDYIFNDKNEYIDGVAGFLDDFADAYKRVQRPKPPEELSEIDKNKALLLSYYAFSQAFMNGGFYQVNDLVYKANTLLLSSKDKNALQLLKQRFNQELTDVDDGLGKYVKEEKNYITIIKLFLESEIKEQVSDKLHILELTDEQFSLLILAINCYNAAIIKPGKASTTSQTGSAGTHFEEKIQAYFLVLMLTDHVIPILSRDDFSWICLQAEAQGYKTDDCVICFAAGSADEQKLLCQVKRRLDNDFEKAISYAWEDFNNSSQFNPKKDKIIFATTTYSEVYHLKAIISAAETSPDHSHYYSLITQQDTQAAAFEKIQEIICINYRLDKHSPDTDKKLFDFIKVLGVIEFSFDLKQGKDEVDIISLIKNRTNCTARQAEQKWASLLKIISEFNERGGKILKSQIHSKFADFFNVAILNSFQADLYRSIDDYFVGREVELTEIEERLFADGSGKNKKILALRGDGGVGKTFLAAKVISRNQGHDKPFRYCYFFNAENPADLVQQYSDFLAQQGIPVSHLINEKTKKEKVIHWLNDHSGWVVLYDNAANHRQINSFLPNRNSGYILVTTRSHSFAPNDKDITQMSENDAVALVKSELNDEVVIEDAELKKLAVELDNNPLALAQAANYIRQRKITVDIYLERYEQSKQKILSFEGLKHRTLTHICVFSTWDMILQEIKETPQIVDLLIICSFLSASGIPHKLLTVFIPEGNDLEDLLVALENYSLIRQQANSVTIHRVLQDVIIVKQKIDKRYEFWLKKIIMTLANQLDFDRNDLNNLIYVKQLIPHVNKMIKLGETEKTEAFADLLYQASLYELDILGSTKYVKTRFEEALSLYTSFGLADKIRKTQRQVSKTLMRQNKFSDAEKVLRKVLPADEANYTIENHCDLANLLLRLKPKIGQKKVFEDSTVLIDDKDKTNENLTKAKAHLTSALNQAKKDYDENNTKKISREYAMVLHYLGNYYFRIGQFQEAYNKYSTSLVIKREAYSKDHFEVARTLHQMGLCSNRQKDYATAISHLADAYEIRRHYHNGNEQIATLKFYSWALIKNINYKLAKDILEKRLELENVLELPTDDTHYWLSLLCSKITNREEALTHLDKIKKDSKKVSSLKAALIDAKDIDQLIKNEGEKIENDDGEVDKDSDAFSENYQTPSPTQAMRTLSGALIANIGTATAVSSTLQASTSISRGQSRNDHHSAGQGENSGLTNEGTAVDEQTPIVTNQPTEQISERYLRH